MKNATLGEVRRWRYWPVRALGMVAAYALLIAASPATAQVGKVIDTRGASIVERQGQSPRLLGAGEDLAERDVIRVSRDGYTMLRLHDNTRVTLRPNTVFRVEAYRESRPENMLLGLLRGGMRVLTGLIAQRNPSAVRFQTVMVTIGVRGTEFDARLCAGDCEQEAGAIPATVAQLPGVIARVVEMKGVAVAATSSGGSLRLAPGAALF